MTRAHTERSTSAMPIITATLTTWDTNSTELMRMKERLRFRVKNLVD